MKRLLPRLFLCALTGVALALIGGVLAPWWVGSDQSLASVAGLMYREVQRGEALSSRDERVRRCLELKTRITAEVLAGRLGLAEAAEAFHESNALLQDGNDSWAGIYRTGRTDSAAAGEEAVFRNVIVWVSQCTSPDPGRRAAVVGRLKEELRQLREARAAGAL